MAFKSLDEQLREPDLLLVDFAKLEHPKQAWLALQAVHAFRAKVCACGRRNRKHISDNSLNPPTAPNNKNDGRRPQPWHAGDAKAVLALAAELNAALPSPVDTIDEQLVRTYAYTAAGCFAPLTAALGGWMAQEILKSLTGKFTPLKQWVRKRGFGGTDRHSCLCAHPSPPSPTAVYRRHGGRTGP